MFTLKLLLKRSCWTFIFMALALPASARVCFLPDSTDCGEGDVEVQITCATYGGYETEAACLEARTNKTAQTCTLNSGCYYPKCAYDSERKCKNENPDKNCLSQDVDGVKCWYSQLKTCFDQGYKSACNSDENSTPVNIEAFDGPCYKCTEKATCKQMKPGVYYGPNDTCPQYTDRKDAGVTGKDGVCSTCEPQACTTINAAYKNAANQNTCGSDKEAKKVEGTDSAADGPCYKCEDKPLEIVKPVITITYKETYNSLTPSMGADPEEYYYKTLKFTATSSDNISRNILMKTYPAKTCKTQYTTGSPVTINEGTETIIGSHCGTKSAVLPVSSVAALDTFINGTKVYSFEPYYSSHILYDGLDGTTVETNDYTVKFVKGKTCSEISNGSWKGEKDKNTCPTGYKPEVVESTIGATAFSDGPCYTCENKPVGCKYEYIRVNPNHTCGNGGNLDAGYSCQRNTCCWNSLSQIKSIDIRGGTGNVMPIYNRISKQSASCVDDKGVTKYETICEGTAKPLCKKAFAPNGCVSASYNNGFDVIGTEWGTCSCDASKGLYDTDKSCSDATSLKCTFEAPCYQTCESAGMYSTEAACMKNLPGGYKCLKPGTDDGDVNCYVRDMGFAIRYASLPKRNWVCSGPTYNTMYQTLRAWLANVSVDSQGRHYPGSYAETLDGKVYSELSDNDLRYKAGSYFVCASRGTTSGNGVGIRKTVIQYTRSASGSDPTTQVCFGDTISSQYNNLTCENSESWGAGYSCKEVTFRKGILYLVSMYTDYQYPGWGYYSGTCNNY